MAFKGLSVAGKTGRFRPHPVPSPGGGASTPRPVGRNTAVGGSVAGDPVAAAPIPQRHPLKQQVTARHPQLNMPYGQAARVSPPERPEWAVSRKELPLSPHQQQQQALLKTTPSDFDAMWAEVRRASAATVPNLKVIRSADAAVGALRSMVQRPDDPLFLFAVGSNGMALTQLDAESFHVRTTCVLDGALCRGNPVTQQALRTLVGAPSGLRMVPSTATIDHVEALCTGPADADEAAAVPVVTNCIAFDLLAMYCGTPPDVLDRVAEAVDEAMDLRRSADLDTTCALLATGCHRTAACFAALSNLMESIAAVARQMATTSARGNARGAADPEKGTAQAWMLQTGAICLMDVESTPQLLQVLQERSERLRRCAAGNEPATSARVGHRLHPANFLVSAPTQDEPEPDQSPASLQRVRSSTPTAPGGPTAGGGAGGVAFREREEADASIDIFSPAAGAKLDEMIRKAAASTLRWRLGGRWHNHRYAPLPSSAAERRFLREKPPSASWRRRAEAACCADV